MGEGPAHNNMWDVLRTCLDMTVAVAMSVKLPTLNTKKKIFRVVRDVYETKTILSCY